MTAILKDYIIIKDSDEQRSDLNRRIKYYLGAKRIDGLSERTLKNYTYNLEMFAERMNKSAAKITTDDIRGYIGYLAENRHLAESHVAANAYQHTAGIFRVAAYRRENQEESR